MSRIVQRWTPAALMAVAACIALTSFADESPKPAEPDARAASLQLMRARADGLTITTDKHEEAYPRVKEAVLRFSDAPRYIADATLWTWGTGGRPAALCKVEHYIYPGNRERWLYCLASLSPDLVSANWKEGYQWSAKKPGVAFREVSGPAPATSKPVRLSQMKEIARRFSSTIADDVLKDRQEMRLLTNPLYRYADAGILDGVVVGLTSNGTNPDVLVLIECRQADGKSTWWYAPTAMTTGGVKVRLDDEQVWSKDYNHPNLGRKFDTWMFQWTDEN